MKAPLKNVGQTGSLPSLPLSPHRRSQGKLPVCPTLAPRFSFFQRVATRHEGSSEKCRANWQFAQSSPKTASTESRQTDRKSTRLNSILLLTSYPISSLKIQRKM